MTTPTVNFLANPDLGVDLRDPSTLASAVLESGADTASLRVSISVEHDGDAPLTAAMWAFCTGLAHRPVQIRIGDVVFDPEPMTVDFDQWVKTDELTVDTSDTLQPAEIAGAKQLLVNACLLYTSPSPRDATLSRMPSSA